MFVDEFQEARRADRRAMLIALQEFDGDLAYPCPVAVVTAGLPSIHGAVTEAPIFGERTHFVEVKGLTAAAAAEAGPPRRGPQRPVGPGRDQRDRTTRRQHPYRRVQLVGACTWDAARPEAGDTISVGHVREALSDVEYRMNTLYRTRWAAARPEHRQMLAAIAAGGSDTAAREEIATYLGRTSSALSRPRHQLIDRGLIEPVGRGTLRFTIPVSATSSAAQSDCAASTTTVAHPTSATELHILGSSTVRAGSSRAGATIQGRRPRLYPSQTQRTGLPDSRTGIKARASI